MVEPLLIDQRAPRVRSRSPFAIGRRLGGSKAGALGGVIVLLAVLAAGAGRALAPAGPLTVNLRAILQPPSRQHLLGTDKYGRDELSRILVATQVELAIAGISAAVALAVGLPLGLVSGYRSGIADLAGSFVVNVVLAFPALLLAMTLVGLLGPGVWNIGLSIGLVSFPVFARLARAGALELKQQPFVEAARVIGAGEGRILVAHILPNVASTMIVQVSLLVGFAILAESSLSFLGLGIRPPSPAWGGMLRDGMNNLRDATHLTVVPGLTIVVAVLGFNLLGDGLSRALNPRTHR